ncbi:hypothetical protein RT99_16825 [Flavobacterium sp. MEB061]|nr:hypothetical protein RT99_16825 [Flavobacterium sp. MEB061]
MSFLQNYKRNRIKKITAFQIFTNQMPTFFFTRKKRANITQKVIFALLFLLFDADCILKLFIFYF